MKILNAMFAKELGGIEQAFLDYTRGLEREGHQVIQVAHKDAKIVKYIQGKYYRISNYSKYDPFTIFSLKKIIKQEQPACIITHGNRPARMFQHATTKIPIISLCHNYSFKQLLKSDAIITVSEDLRKSIIQDGYPSNRVFAIPNMIDIDENEQFDELRFHTPPMIGALGRFVKKKGFDIFLEALSILDKKGVSFQAVIGGDGEEKKQLEDLHKSLNLQSKVKFLGWIEDKESFYKSIDVFCLISFHEPFGIVIIEAFKYCRPVIVTNTEGPSDIVQNGYNGLFIEIQNAQSLADKIESLINNNKLATELANNGFATCKKRYSTKVVMKRINNVIQEILKEPKILCR